VESSDSAAMEVRYQRRTEITKQSQIGWKKLSRTASVFGWTHYFDLLTYVAGGRGLRFPPPVLSPCVSGRQ
jgi:hypothetical protein